MRTLLRTCSRNLRVSPQNRPYAEVLVRLVGVNLQRIDRSIEDALTNWRLERLSVIDRNVLRLGVAEMLFVDDVPPRLTIREMVRLAEKYGTHESPRFVNGVLDAVMRVVAPGRLRRRERARTRGEAPGRQLAGPANPQSGGAEIHLHEIFGRLAARGHQVTLPGLRVEGRAAAGAAGRDARSTGSGGATPSTPARPAYYRRHLAAGALRRGGGGR